MSGHGGHYMLYMANGLFVVFLDADWYRYLISVLSIVPQQIEQRVSFFESDSKKI